MSKFYNIKTYNKVLIISSFFSIFFLFTAGYVFPGGANHYPFWALAIAEGKTLPLTMAQREVGLPLLYLLSGFTFTKSFIVITIFYSLFGLIIPSIYFHIFKNISDNDRISYYLTFLLFIIFTPYTYSKFFYPDQLYMFLKFCIITNVIFLIWKKKLIYLYLITIFAILLTLTRTSATIIFPFILLLIPFFVSKIKIKHYIICILIFLSFSIIYKIHKNNIFDLNNINLTTKPVGKGYQILYSAYLNLGDFGYKLSPDMGPATKMLFKRMDEEIKENVRDSKLFEIYKNENVEEIDNTPLKFMEEHFFRLSKQELIDRVASIPNEEYFFNVLFPIKRKGLALNQDTDDEFHLDIAKEIWKNYPLYIMKYGTRNLIKMIFDPGWAINRYSTGGLTREGRQFIPDHYSFDKIYSTDSTLVLGETAAREFEYRQLKDLPNIIQGLFYFFKNVHRKLLKPYIYLSGIVILLGWAYILVILTQNKILKKNFLLENKDNKQKILLSKIIIIVSIIYLYEGLLTALFSQPTLRYFHLTEPIRAIIVGLIIILLTYNLRNNSVLKYNNSKNLKIDFFTILIIMITVLGYSFWGYTIITKTHKNYPLRKLTVYDNSGKNVIKKIISNDCKYYTCNIKFDDDIGSYGSYIEFICLNKRKQKIEIKNKKEIQIDCYNS